jgi:hypothetical protein
MTESLLLAAAPRSATMARRWQRGLALPLVLMIVAMMLVTSSAWFESALFDARQAGATVDDLQSFHAADSALRLCARVLLAGSVAVPSMPDARGEPSAWLRQTDFDARAFIPVDSWPGSVRPPQCMIEGWRLDERPDARAFLLTARGFGASLDAQNWLQLQLVLDGSGGKVESHWRRVVSRPF